MNSIDWTTFIPFGQAVGWTVLHSIWQLTLVGIGLRLLLHLIPQRNPNLRYSLLCASLLVSLFWVGSTFSEELSYAQANLVQQEMITLETNHPTVDLINDTPPVEESSTSVARGASYDLGLNMFLQKLEPFVPIIAISWYIGVLVFSFLMLLGFLKLRRFRKENIQEPKEYWIQRFKELQDQMGISRKIQFSISGSVQEPITFNFFRPVILAPIGIFSGLNPEQIEILILHELAHIRRHDFLINIFQSMVEALFFYHPVVWWVSGKIREEREHCCDDLVLKIQNKPLLYAEALTRLYVIHQPIKTKLVMSANGNKSSFSKRIYRMFGQYDQRPSVLRGSFDRPSSNHQFIGASIFYT